MLQPEPMLAGCNLSAAETGTQTGCFPDMECTTLGAEEFMDATLLMEELIPRSTLAVSWTYADSQNGKEIAVKTYFAAPLPPPDPLAPADPNLEKTWTAPPEPGALRAPANEVSEGAQTAPDVSFTAKHPGESSADLLLAPPAISFDLVWKTSGDYTGLRGMRYQYRWAQLGIDECEGEDGMCAALVRQPRIYE